MNRKQIISDISEYPIQESRHDAYERGQLNGQIVHPIGPVAVMAVLSALARNGYIVQKASTMPAVNMQDGSNEG